MPVLTLAAVGILLKLASTIAFTGMSSLVRVAGSDVPVGQVVFCRSLFALIPLFAILAWRGEIGEALRVNSFSGHMKRGAIGAFGMLCGFTALSLLPLADAVAIGYAAPLMVVPLAVLMLGETVRIYRWTAVAIGFCGVIVILWPYLGTGTSDRAAIGAWFALAGAVCAAFATIQVRRLLSTETTASIVFLFMTLSTLLSLTSLPLGSVIPWLGVWIWPTPGQMATLVTIGILGGLGQICLTESYRRADASLVAPFEYFSMIWAVLFGYLLFADLPGPSVLIGGAIVVGSGLFVIWREHRLGLKRDAQRRVQTPQG